MKKIIILLIAVLSTQLIVSCKNPESDGKKVAENYCDCKTKSADEQNQANKDFLTDLQNSKYTSHFYAQKKLESIQHQASQAAHICDSTAQAEQKEALSPYLTNQANSEKFQFAFAAQLSACKQSTDQDLYSNIQTNISSMSDPKPDIDRIKLELLGIQLGIKGGGTWKFENMSQYVKASVTDVKAVPYNNRILNYTVQMQLKDLKDNTLHDCIISAGYYGSATKWWSLNGVNMQSFK